MNNYYNFSIPAFHQQYGEDWDDFNDIMEDEVDNVFERIYSLYHLNDPNYMSEVVVDLLLTVLQLSINPSESLAIKKSRIRKFLTMFKDKGTEDIYLDFAEAVAGTRGAIYSGYIFGVWRADVSRWHDSSAPADDDIKWSSPYARFLIYIDVKTTDSDELDEICEIYRLPYMLPAFYQVYLIDTDFNLLRTI